MNRLLLSILALALIATSAAAQNDECYIDPFTGRKVCPRQQQQQFDRGGDFRIGEAPSNYTQLPETTRRTPDGQLVAPFTPQTPWQESRLVKIRNGEGGGFSYGSGAVVSINGDAGYILTCAHVTGGMNDWVLIIFNDGRDSDVAKVIGYNRQADCAVLKLANGARKESFTIAPKPPQANEPIYVAGFPKAGNVRVRQANTTGDIYIGSASLRGGAIDGESGGPVCNQAEEIVGVIWGNDPRTNTTQYCPLEPINMMLAQYCGQPPPQWVGPAAPQYQQRPPQSRPPVQQQTTPTPIAGPPGPKGEPGPPGPTGPPGPGSSCDCGPKWETINQRVTLIENEMKDGKVAITNVLGIVQKLEQQKPPTAAEVADLVKVPTVPTMDEIVAEVERRRKPPRIRIVDANGDKFTTEFLTLHDNTDNDLIIDQRFSIPATAP